MHSKGGVQTIQICKEKKNINKLYMIAREHWFPVYGLTNECI